MRRYRIALISTGVVVVSALLLLAGMWLSGMPSTKDFAAVQDTYIKRIKETQSKLAPAANTYMDAFKKHEIETGSVMKAAEMAKSELNDFKAAEQNARDALDELLTSKVMNDRQFRDAAEMLVREYTERTDYFSGMANSYQDLNRLFGGESNDVCLDVFLGGTTSMADRRDRLAAALGNCYDAVAVLKTSNNSTYVEYAKQTESRLKEMEGDAKVVAKSEADHAKFTAEAEQLKTQASTLQTGDGSSRELKEVLGKIEKLNQQISDSKASLTYSGDRYVADVKDLAPLYERVFSEDVPAKVKYFTAITDARLKALRFITESKQL